MTIADYLHQLYQQADFYQPFERGGLRYPVSIFLPDASQIDDVDSLLSLTAPHEQEQHFDFLARSHLDKLLASGRRMEDKPTFVLDQIITSPTLKISARLGTYFHMLMTCDALDVEIREYAPHPLPPPPVEGGEQSEVLPYRSQIKRREVLINGAGRSAAIGMTTLVVFPKNGNYHTLIGQRSGSTAIEPGRFQVIPAGVFQPITTNIAAEWNLTTHLEREILEELFGLPEPHEPPLNPCYFADHPAYLHLQDLKAHGLATFHLAGIAINLLTLRPEICTLLLIRDPQWIETLPIGGSWELGKHLHTPPITSDADLLAYFPADFPTRMTPQGSAALWLGVDLARKLL